MSQEITFLAIALSPLIIGVVIAALNKDEINNFTESIEAGIRKRQDSASQSTGWLYRIVVNPFFLVLVKFSDFTDSFTHRGLKNGTRVAATLYFIAGWGYLMSIAFAVVATFLIGGLIIYYVHQYSKSKNNF